MIYRLRMLAGAVIGALSLLLPINGVIAATLLGPATPTPYLAYPALPLGQDTVVTTGSGYAYPGGTTWTYGNIALANQTSVWHAPLPNSVKFGAGCLCTSTFTFNAAASNLAGGILVFFDNSGTQRATLRYKTLADAPLALATPASVGAPASVGGLAPVPFAGFKLNFAFEVPYSGVWTAPATIDNGFGNGTIQFASDFTAGFYWNNVDPKLNVNTGTTLAQSASTTITSAMLSSSDVESGAGAITYKVNGLTHNGTLKKNGTGMAVNDTFTQQDIANGVISYTNNGACDTNDDFQFGVTDADGGIAHDGAFTSFSFRFTIALPNNPPTANGASISVGLGATKTGALTASNNDCFTPTYTFSLGTLPTKGNVTLTNAATGAYSYTATAGQSGADSFTFNVTDGVVSSTSPGTISITIANQAPVAQDQTVNTNEGAAVNGALVATDVDLPPQTLTYTIVANGTKGTVSITDANTGAFTYTPASGRMGADTFTFKANDGSLDSNIATVTVAIRPNMTKPGRIVTTGGASSPGGNAVEVLGIDPVTADQGVISKAGSITNATGVAIEPSSGKILVMNMSGSGSLLRIDPADGSQATVATGFSASPPNVAIGVAVEASGNILTALGSSGVKRINPSTGAILDTFSGGNLNLPVGVTVAANGDIYVSDAAGAFGGTNAVIKIDPSSGARTVVSSGGSLQFPAGILMTPAGKLYVADAPGTFGGGGTQAIYDIDLGTGTQTAVSTGGSLANPLSLALAPDGTLLTANHAGNGSIVSVTPPGPAGAQAVISSAGELKGAWGIAVVPWATNLLVSAPASVAYNTPFNVTVTARDASNGTVTGYTGTVHLTTSDGLGVLPPDATLTNGVGVFSVTLKTPGSQTVTATDTVTSSITGTSAAITVGKIAQTIAFNNPGAHTFATSPTLTATATSGLTVSFSSSTTGVCTITSGGALTFVTVGNCTIAADQAGNATYDVAPQVTQTFAVNKANQAINFTSTAPGAAVVGGATYAVAATGGASGNPVTFTSGAPSVCTVAGSTVSFIAVGTCIVNANQLGNANYNAAPQAQQSFAVGKGANVINITSTPPGRKVAGGPTYTPAATATSGLAVTFSIASASAAVCSISSGVVRFIGVGTCTLNADQAGNANFLAATQVQQSFSVKSGAGHDFDGAGKADILWRGPAGEVAVWLMNGGTLLSGPGVSGAPLSWTIAGTGDFDGDGKSDILWRGPGGEVAIWFMNGGTLLSGPIVAGAPTTWTIAATGDFDGDGKSDILWRGPSGEVAMWFMNGATITSGPLVSTVPLNWTIQKTGDFNGDGKSDILWRDVTGTIALWTMNGATPVSFPTIATVPTNWTIAGTGDFNGDGKSDLLWRDVSGAVALWIMNGSTPVAFPTISSAPTTWTIVGTGDFNGDLSHDVLWRGPAGEVAVWLISGGSLTSGPVVGGAPLNWVIQRME